MDNPVQSNPSSNKLLEKVSIYLIYLRFSLLSAVLCNELFIIANVLCMLFSSQMASFVDKLLQPIAQKQKSYLKDTTDFVNFIEKTKVSQDTILRLVSI